MKAVVIFITEAPGGHVDIKSDLGMVPGVRSTSREEQYADAIEKLVVSSIPGIARSLGATLVVNSAKAKDN